MEEVLDSSLFEREKPSVSYGGFWIRVGALILDGLILAPVTWCLSYFNITTWKSSLLLIALTLIGIIYKPFMEYAYGATLGKMALKLVVKKADFEKAELGDILLRNIFQIAIPLISLYFTVRLYNDPEFESVSGYTEYSMYVSRFWWLSFVNYAGGLIYFVDAIVLATDKQKRSLHDKIAGTVVILKSR